VKSRIVMLGLYETFQNKSTIHFINVNDEKHIPQKQFLLCEKVLQLFFPQLQLPVLPF